MARELIARFDAAQDLRPLSTAEAWLPRELKRKYLGLASLHRSIVRQRLRLRWLKEGEASSAFSKIHASHRAKKNTISDLAVNGTRVSGEVDLARAAFDHFSAILGSQEGRTVTLNLQAIGHPSFLLSDLEAPFTSDEIWEAIKKLPSGKAPGPDGFTYHFYATCWEIIKEDIMAALDSFSRGDMRGLHAINKAIVSLLPKVDGAIDI